MISDPHQRARELFSRARKLDAAGRAALLRQECADDSDLRGELLSLLQAHDEAEGFLEARPGSFPERAKIDSLIEDAVEAGDEQLPEGIGGYRIFSRLGAGGMGVVYEAEQSSPKRRVALKVLSSGAASPQTVRRFEREAEILGRLRHPGIAQVLEAGVTISGAARRPWFAMELVNGLPITEHAERVGLDTRERLRLLALTCDAVDHAHARGVVHRDLKPANVLVDQDGRPKVLDFGIARPLDEEGRPATRHTGTGQIIGTLAYLSPEQAAGRSELVDPRSDVHALGVLAFELLTGRLPHVVDGKPLHEALHLLLEVEAPSITSVDPALRGDPATIVAKALAKDRDRRYASAAELAADIRRSLSDQPIQARPASAAYLFRKFARRHRAPVAAAALALVALVLGAAVAVQQAVVAGLARDEAQSRERQARLESYKAHLAAAQVADTADDPTLGMRQLGAVPVEQRGFEWDLLAARFDDGAMALPGPPSPIEAISVAPDGDGVFAAGSGELVAWDWPSGRPASRHDLSERPLVVPAGALDLVQRTAAPAWEEGAVDIREAGTGRLLGRVASCPGAQPGFEALAGDGSVGLQRDFEDRGIVLCDPGTGLPIADRESTRRRDVLALSPDGRRFLIGSARRLLLGDSETGQAVWEATQDGGWVESVAYGPLGRRIYHGGYQGELFARDAYSGALLERRRTQRRGPLARLGLSPDGRLVATAGSEGLIRVFRTDTLELVSSLRAGASEPHALVFSADGRQLLAIDGEALHAWTLEPPWGDDVHPAHDSFVYPVRGSGSGRFLFSGGWDEHVRIWCPRSRQLLAEFRVGPPAFFVSWLEPSPDGRYLAIGGMSGELALLDLRTGRKRLHASADRSESALAWSADSRWIFRGDQEGLTAFDTQLRPAPTRLVGPHGRVALDPTGRLLAAASQASIGQVIELREGDDPLGDVVLELDSPPGYLRGLFWNRDGTQILTTEEAGPIRLFDTATGDQLAELERPFESKSFHARWTSDESRILAGTGDGRLHVWKADTLEHVITLDGHGGYLFSFDQLFDGELLVSGSGDGTLRWWDSRPRLEAARAGERAQRLRIELREAASAITLAKDPAAALDQALAGRDEEEGDALAQLVLQFGLERRAAAGEEPIRAPASQED